MGESLVTMGESLVLVGHPVLAGVGLFLIYELLSVPRPGLRVPETESRTWCRLVSASVALSLPSLELFLNWPNFWPHPTPPPPRLGINVLALEMRV